MMSTDYQALVTDSIDRHPIMEKVEEEGAWQEYVGQDEVFKSSMREVGR